MEEQLKTEMEKLEYQLCCKVEQELNDFKEELKSKTPEKIIENSYKLVCMECIEDYLTEKDYSKFEIKTLLKRTDLLEECYDDWLNCDGSLREILEYSVDNTIDIIRDDEVKKQRNKDAR